MDHGGMDHGGMDHGGMDHGGMDMGNKCNMNVGNALPFAQKVSHTHVYICTDALHVGYYEFMHRFPLVAHHFDIYPPHLPRRRSSTHGRLRGCPRGEQEIRA